MKKIFQITVAVFLLTGCGEKKEEKKDGFEMNRTKKEANDGVASDGVPVDMDNKGIGPITSLTFEDEIDGEPKFQMICTACHMIGQRMIGPDLTGIYERRSPEWVMNMMLNPDGMLKEDAIAKALLREYNNMVMTNQNLSEEEARALAEYLRTL